MRVNCSALEIARQAGWDDSVSDIETRVRTALAALEQGGYLVRGNNVPHVYATGITVKNMDEARTRISASLNACPSRCRYIEHSNGRLAPGRDRRALLPVHSSPENPNGKMDSDEKITNQNAFMTDAVRIIVATSAFGMGVDKKDVGMVIHYDISDSLENYVQEAGHLSLSLSACITEYCRLVLEAVDANSSKSKSKVCLK